MSLVCSLVGHDWGEERVETERDEARGQVAVTERAYRECTRCGERRVVTENTEVRPVDEDRRDEVNAEEAGSGADATDTEDVTTFEPSDADDEPDGYDADETEDAAILDDTDDGAGGATPDVDVSDAVRESTGAEVTRETTPDASDAYVCPECGFSSSNPSRREGDLCPECRNGYLEEA